MNLVCFASSFLCILIAWDILFLSLSRSSFIFWILCLCSCCLMCSALACSAFCYYFTKLFYFSLCTSFALFRVSSIFFHVLISSCRSKAIRFASNCASLSVLQKDKITYFNNFWLTLFVPSLPRRQIWLHPAWRCKSRTCSFCSASCFLVRWCLEAWRCYFPLTVWY